MKPCKTLRMKKNAIRQPYMTKTRPCQRNQLCDEYLDEPETRTAELITDAARFSTFQTEASAAHRSLATRVQQDLRRSCGRARDKLDLIPGSTRRVCCGVCGLFNSILALQNSCERTTLTSTDFTIQFPAKTQTLTLYSCAQRCALPAGGRDAITPL